MYNIQEFIVNFVGKHRQAVRGKEAVTATPSGFLIQIAFCGNVPLLTEYQMPFIIICSFILTAIFVINCFVFRYYITQYSALDNKNILCFEFE